MSAHPLASVLATRVAGGHRIARLRAPASLVRTPVALPAVEDGLVGFDLDLAEGRLAFAPPGTLGDALDGGERIVLPGLCDLHTHLDMAHVVDVAPNPPGTHFGAVQARDRYRAAAIARGEAWRAADLERRMTFGLRCAEAHGVRALRTHLDSLPAQAALSWATFERLRDRWRGRIDLQGVALVPVDTWLGDDGVALVDRVAAAGGIPGAVTRFAGRGHGAPDGAMQGAIERLLRLAAERGLDVDLHVDESGDPAARALDLVVAAVEATGFPGTVVCGHCCSLTVRPAEEAAAAIARVAAAGIGVVSLPHVNLYLQDRTSDRTPRWRGVTALHELRAAGVPLAVGTDNVRDYFYAWGDHDTLRAWTDAVLIAHLDRPAGDWIDLVTSTPARLMRAAGHGLLVEGGAADGLITAGRRWSEVVARPGAARVIVRGGVAASVTPPEFSELDEG